MCQGNGSKLFDGPFIPRSAPRQLSSGMRELHRSLTICVQLLLAMLGLIPYFDLGIAYRICNLQARQPTPSDTVSRCDHQ